VKIINLVSRVAGYVATVVLVALMLLTVADVFLRYVFANPITGTAELTELMMVCLLLALAWCAVEGRHIKVGILMDRFSPRVQATADSITLLASLGVYIILVWQGFVASLYSWDFDVKSSMLDVPQFPFIMLLALSFAMLCIAMVTLLIQRIAELVKR
jgi:TRAP-type C4-dicarboxylate transport system permease small subunit